MYLLFMGNTKHLILKIEQKKVKKYKTAILKILCLFTFVSAGFCKGGYQLLCWIIKVFQWYHHLPCLAQGTECHGGFEDCQRNKGHLSQQL